MKKELRGNQFIAEKKEGHKRTCKNCFYGCDDGEYQGKCLTTEPKKLFQIPKGEDLKDQLDGKQVGHYCPTWAYVLDFDE